MSERKGGYAPYWEEMEAMTLIDLRPVDEALASQLKPGAHDVTIRKMEWGNGWVTVHFEGRAGRRIARTYTVPSAEYLQLSRACGYEVAQYAERLVGGMCNIRVDRSPGMQLFYNTSGQVIMLDTSDELIAVYPDVRTARAELRRIRQPEARYIVSTTMQIPEFK